MNASRFYFKYMVAIFFFRDIGIMLLSVTLLTGEHQNLIA